MCKRQNDIRFGWALLHEMPTELMDGGSPSERAAWIKQQAIAPRAEASAQFDSFLRTVGLPPLAKIEPRTSSSEEDTP